MRSLETFKDCFKQIYGRWIQIKRGLERIGYWEVHVPGLGRREILYKTVQMEGVRRIKVKDSYILNDSWQQIIEKFK